MLSRWAVREASRIKKYGAQTPAVKPYGVGTEHNRNKKKKLVLRCFRCVSMLS